MQCVHTQLPDWRKWEAPVWENTHFCSDCKMVVIKCYLENAIKTRNCTFAWGVGLNNNQTSYVSLFSGVCMHPPFRKCCSDTATGLKDMKVWLCGWLFSLPHLMSYHRAWGRTWGQQYSQAWFEVVSTAAPADVCTPMFHGPKYIPGHAVTTPEYIG